MTNTSLFVQLFMGFLLSVSLADSNCPIKLDPPKVVMKYGDSVSISCIAEGEHQGIGWEAAVNGTGNRMVDRLTWSVESLKDVSRDVMCFVNLKPEGQCYQTADIVLYTMPENITITSNKTDAVEGEDFYMTCETGVMAPAQNLSVMWYKDDSHFKTFYNSSDKLLNETTIKITLTREDHSAEFKCEAHLDLTPEGPYINVSSEIFKLNVKFGPEMSCVDEEIAEGETLDSKCPVYGNPTPNVTWFKNGREINPSQPLTREDAGVYSVDAKGFSSIKKNVSVLVLYGPELNCSHIYTALEHTTINLNCTIGGYPKPNVTLYKEDEEVYLGNITRNDAGNYALVASIGNHSVTQTFEVIVYYPPSQIEDELEDSDFTLGSSVDLKCSAKGNPRPKYTWIYFDTPNVSERNDDGVSILEIHNATTFNIGTYKCTASNEHGSVSKTARLTAEGAKEECPLQITPAERMVLEYKSERKSAMCKSTFTKEIYWLDNGENNINGLELVADTHNWDAKPVICEGVFPGLGTCSKKLDIILYKKPDDVSIRMKEDNVTVKDIYFTLVCEITNFAPANVSVRWLKGNAPFTPPHKVHQSCSGCNTNQTRTVNMSFSTSIPVNRELNGVEFSCTADFDLPEIQNITLPPPRPLNITVNYPPSINTTKLSSPVPVFSGYAEDLKCEADGNPRPEIRWSSNNETLPDQRSDGMLSVTEKGIYRCTATNAYGSDYRDVEVIVKVDYLPLIAGFVAVTVVIISIIFVFIYSIYYKNTKMRRYNLKKPKLCALNNGNVAHNGWDLPLPMTKLS